MRIAFVTTSYPAYEGDPSGHFVETEARLRAGCDEVWVVTAAPQPSGASDRGTRGHAGGPSREGALRVLRLEGGGAFGWPGVAARLVERPTRAVSAGGWLLRARRALAALRPDRVVAHWTLPCAFPVAAGLGVPQELVSHGADVRLLVGLPAVARAALVRVLLREAAAWRFVSTGLLDDLTRALPDVLAHAVRAIAEVAPPAIDVPDVREEAFAVRSSMPSGPLAVSVARLVPGKRVDRVIRAVAAEGRGTRLVVVGDGPSRQRLEALARRLGVDACFVGQVPRRAALAWIAASDEVLHASEAEGCSTVEREAIALGIPFRDVRASRRVGVHGLAELR